SSCPTHFDRLKLSTTVFMYCFGDCRSVALLPWASRSRSRWRIFSRSSATARMRLSSVSVTRYGMGSVMKVAIAAMPAKNIVITCGSSDVRSPNMPRPSEVEVDHLAHHHDADEHPGAAAAEHDAAHRFGPKQLDVGGAGEIDEAHHHDRQRADDCG